MTGSSSSSPSAGASIWFSRFSFSSSAALSDREILRCVGSMRVASTTVRIGAAAWTLKPTTESVQINGADATRFVLTRPDKKGEVRREATAFRRPGRAYYFILTFAAGDAGARDAARQCIQSVTWSK